MVQVGRRGDHARGELEARVAIVVHDFQKIQVIGLHVANVCLDGCGAGDVIGVEMVPERDGRPIRLAALDNGSDSFDFVHGFREC